MKRLFIALTAFAAACSPPANENTPINTSEPSLPDVTLPVADAAGNRMETLTQSGGRWCTADGAWCLAPATDKIDVSHSDASAGTITIGEVAEGDDWAPWPQITRIGRNDASVLVGVVRGTHQMYSGGGGEASQLVLYEIAENTAREVARLPLGGSSTVRACFDEDDERQRAGACHDQYTFVTRLSLDEGVATGSPQIILETAAGSYPGRVTRNADSLEAPALQQSDLVWARDETCSYRRTYVRAPDGLYAPNEPLPACSDYLEP